MVNNNKFKDFSIHRDWDKEASTRVKQYLDKMGLSQKLLAHLIDMPIPTFNDKIAGKTAWKLSEIAKVCFILGETSDCIIFGDPLFITEYYNWNRAATIISHTLKTSIKRNIDKV